MKGSDCIGALKAMGEENRIRILRLLLAEESSVNAISEKLGLSPYNVSKHLGILRAAGLVASRKDGRERVYSVAPEVGVQLSSGRKVMDLGCCSFRVDQLPK